MIERKTVRSRGDPRRGKPGILARDTLNVRSPASGAAWDQAREQLRDIIKPTNRHPVELQLDTLAADAAAVLRAAGMPTTWPECSRTKGEPFSDVEAAQTIIFWAHALRCTLAALDDAQRHRSLEALFQYGHVLQAAHHNWIARNEAALLAGSATQAGGRKGTSLQWGDRASPEQAQRLLDEAFADWHRRYPGQKCTLKAVREHAAKMFEKSGVRYKRLVNDRMKPTNWK